MAGPKILIADDDSSFRRVLEYQLKQAGYEVRTAGKEQRRQDLGNIRTR